LYAVDVEVLAMNSYPVVVAESGTYIGNARWGQNAERRAKEQGHEMAIHLRKMATIHKTSEFIYEILVVEARTRKDVVALWSVAPV
jgi:hypothetical protein